MFTKKQPGESFGGWFKRNWKDLALLTLGAIVGAQILIGLYYGIAFLFFILKGSIGYAAAGGIAAHTHFSVASMLGISALVAGGTILAASMYKKFHRSSSSANQHASDQENVTPDGNQDFEFKNTHQQVNEKLHGLAPQSSGHNFDNSRIRDFEYPERQSNTSFLSRAKAFFQNLPLFFSKRKADCFTPSPSVVPHEPTVRPK